MVDVSELFCVMVRDAGDAVMLKSGPGGGGGGGLFDAHTTHMLPSFVWVIEGFVFSYSYPTSVKFISGDHVFPLSGDIV